MTTRRNPALATAMVAMLCGAIPAATNLLAHPANASTQPHATDAEAERMLCAERAVIVAQLAARFHEQQEQTVLRSETSLMELFVSSRGTWSILHTSPAGYSCIVATGHGLAPTAQL